MSNLIKIFFFSKQSLPHNLARSISVWPPYESDRILTGFEDLLLLLRLLRYYHDIFTLPAFCDVFPMPPIQIVLTFAVYSQCLPSRLYQLLRCITNASHPGCTNFCDVFPMPPIQVVLTFAMYSQCLPSRLYYLLRCITNASHPGCTNFCDVFPMPPIQVVPTFAMYFQCLPSRLYQLLRCIPNASHPGCTNFCDVFPMPPIQVVPTTCEVLKPPIFVARLLCPYTIAIF